MKLNSKLNHHFCALITAVILTGIATDSAFAKQGATDPIPGTSKGTVSTGGGGGGGGKTSTVTTLPPIPSTPIQPVATGTINFVSARSLSSTPASATGTYRIDPYYPTLSLLTVTVTCNISVPDGTQVFMNVFSNNGTLYPFTSNAITITGGQGTGSYSVYVTPGTILAGVTVCDNLGQAYLTGQ